MAIQNLGDGKEGRRGKDQLSAGTRGRAGGESRVLWLWLWLRVRVMVVVSQRETSVSPTLSSWATARVGPVGCCLRHVPAHASPSGRPSTNLPPSVEATCNRIYRRPEVLKCGCVPCTQPVNPNQFTRPHQKGSWWKVAEVVVGRGAGSSQRQLAEDWPKLGVHSPG
eukprot:364577-Chlamydomonas_euryale.AAC.28